MAMNNDLREIAIRTDSGDAWENPFSQGVGKTGEEVDEQLIKLLQSDKYQKLLKRIESSPKMPIERWTGDEREIICPACKSYICYPEDIKTIDLKYRQFCGACGQKLNWEIEGEEG